MMLEMCWERFGATLGKLHYRGDPLVTKLGYGTND